MKTSDLIIILYVGLALEPRELFGLHKSIVSSVKLFGVRVISKTICPFDLIEKP